MTALDWFNSALSIAGLLLGYISARGELQRLRGIRKVPKLIKEKAFYERLRASPPAQQAYLLESMPIILAIIGAGTMCAALASLPPSNFAKYEPLRNWAVGGTTYLFSLYHLGKYWNVTKRYEKTMNRLNAEITHYRQD